MMGRACFPFGLSVALVALYGISWFAQWNVFSQYAHCHLDSQDVSCDFAVKLLLLLRATRFMLSTMACIMRTVCSMERQY